MSDPLRDAYVEAIETENDELRIRVADLEREFGFRNTVPLMFGLTPSEAKVLSLLLVRDIATKGQIMTAIMSDRGADAEPEMKIVDVYVCKIRNKVRPFGISIETVWGRGYTMSRENKEKVTAFLNSTEVTEHAVAELSLA